MPKRKNDFTGQRKKKKRDAAREKRGSPLKTPGRQKLMAMVVDDGHGDSTSAENLRRAEAAAEATAKAAAKAAKKDAKRAEAAAAAEEAEEAEAAEAAKAAELAKERDLQKRRARLFRILSGSGSFTATQPDTRAMVDEFFEKNPTAKRHDVGNTVSNLNPLRGAASKKGSKSAAPLVPYTVDQARAGGSGWGGSGGSGSGWGGSGGSGWGGSGSGSGGQAVSFGAALAAIPPEREVASAPARRAGSAPEKRTRPSGNLGWRTKREKANSWTARRR
jgi:hypothetical protein